MHIYISHMRERGQAPPTIYSIHTYGYVSSVRIISLEYVHIFAPEHTPVKTQCICFAQDVHRWICPSVVTMEFSKFIFVGPEHFLHSRQNVMHMLSLSQFSSESAQAWWHPISVINFVGLGEFMSNNWIHRWTFASGSAMCTHMTIQLRISASVVT